MQRRRATSRALSAIVALAGIAAALWGLLVAYDGGPVRFLGLRLSSRHPFLLLLGGLGALGVHAWVWRPAIGPPLATLATPSRRAASIAAAALALIVLSASVHWASAVAGGADSYGYVSQAGLWRQGELLVRGDIIRQSPWPLAIETWSPLGYRPASGRKDAIAPIYPPGFPWLMALFQLALGYCGAFYVVPVCSGAAVVMTYALGVRVFGRPAPSLWAALLLAASPTFLYQSVNPMTDVPTTAAWALVLLLVVAERPLAAGLAMAVALAIRPNLVLVAAAVCSWVALGDWKRWRTDHRVPTRTIRLAVGVAPVVAGLAWLNTHLFGSPLMSGYGSLGPFYSTTHFWTNIATFTRWTVETQTPVVFAGVLFFVLPRAFREPRIDFPRVLLGGTMLAVVVSYVFYMPFGAWWFLRFLLPMWPVLMLVTAVVLDAIVRRWPSTTSRLAVLGCLALITWWGVTTADERRAFDLWRGERRFVDVARYVSDHTDSRAVILTSQHSGSIRHYAGRLTLRWDLLHAAWLDRAIAYLAETGRHPYVLLDDDEIEKFRTRFRDLNRLGALDWTPAAVLDFPRVVLYDAVDRTPRRPAFVAGSARGAARWRCDLPQRWPTPLRME